MSPDHGPVTRLLQLLRDGDRGVIPQLVELQYLELRRIAAARMQVERNAHTLTPTALVHEAYLRLAGATELQFQDRAHLLAVGAQAMRRVLVDHARTRAAVRRGGGKETFSLADIEVAAPQADDKLLELDEALSQLAKLSPRACSVVEMRYFAGLNEDEIAAALGVTRRTVDRDWKTARAWLNAQLRSGRETTNP